MRRSGVRSPSAPPLTHIIPTPYFKYYESAHTAGATVFDYLSLRNKGSSLLKFAMPPTLSSNSDAARVTGLSVRFECDDAGAN